MHPALLESSGWTYSRRFRELSSAHAWGCATPEDFDLLSKDYRLDIMAWYETKWRIDAVNSYEAQQKAHRSAKKGKKK